MAEMTREDRVGWYVAGGAGRADAEVLANVEKRTWCDPTEGLSGAELEAFLAEESERRNPGPRGAGEGSASTPD